MTGLTAKSADAIVRAAIAFGRDHDFMPLTVAVLDAGGHLVAFLREDGSGIMRPDVAIGKAWGAIGMGANSRQIRDRLADRPSFQNALAAVSGGKFVPVPGGVLIRDEDGAVIGGVAVSGDTSDKDEVCAIAGIKSAGLLPDPAEPISEWDQSRL
jgi:uncharacterized protein GlcG (DUF336 family)